MWCWKSMFPLLLINESLTFQKVSQMVLNQIIQQAIMCIHRCLHTSSCFSCNCNASRFVCALVYNFIWKKKIPFVCLHVISSLHCSSPFHCASRFITCDKKFTALGQWCQETAEHPVTKIFLFFFVSLLLCSL